ncbi:MAG: non-hydrolyzing UDP-N-acetylglucosamine 2-epimerase [Terriglobales bacterium]
MNRKTIAVVFGTRPEAIKMAPVIKELQTHPDKFDTLVISTAQHRQMLDQVLSTFEIKPDIDLNLMTHNQSLSGITQRVLESLEAVLSERQIDCLMVQGDTTTAFAAALAAFYRKIPVAHVEAGLRSRDMMNPWPEEANRRLAGVVTGLHLAPTATAKENLLGESVDPDAIVVTGNTVVDAAHWLMRMKKTDEPLPEGIPEDARLLLVTSHRRESWGTELENVCDAINDLVAQFPDIHVLYPVHLNPNVRGTVREKLEGVERVHLTAPMDYFQFVSVLRRSYLVLTDSGGVQEEAPTFGKPVLVLRKVTERPEASMMGLARIVGTSRERIVQEAATLLTNRSLYRSMSEAESPYGDGRASQRISQALTRWFQGSLPILQDEEQFSYAPRLVSVAA